MAAAIGFVCLFVCLSFAVFVWALGGLCGRRFCRSVVLSFCRSATATVAGLGYSPLLSAHTHSLRFVFVRFCRSFDFCRVLSVLLSLALCVHVTYELTLSLSPHSFIIQSFVFRSNFDSFSLVPFSPSLPISFPHSLSVALFSQFCLCH